MLHLDKLFHCQWTDAEYARQDNLFVEKLKMWNGCVRTRDGRDFKIRSKGWWNIGSSPLYVLNEI